MRTQSPWRPWLGHPVRSADRPNGGRFRAQRFDAEQKTIEIDRLFTDVKMANHLITWAHRLAAHNPVDNLWPMLWIIDETIDSTKNSVICCAA
jgi:hypothetical protein